MIKRAEWVALGIVSLLVLILTLNWAIRASVHSQKDVVVPNLNGQSLLQALDTLSKLNLGLKQDGAENNASVPSGTVLRQQPPAGMPVREGKIIRVTLSQGGESIFTPDLIGQSLRSAEIALRLNGVGLGEVESRPSLKYEKDIVISQDPKPKTIIEKNSLVHLTVSEGAPKDGSILMPDFVGKNIGTADAWSKEKNIKIETVTEESPQEDGIILRQSPSADDAVQNGLPVSFVISKKSVAAPLTPKATGQ